MRSSKPSIPELRRVCQPTEIVGWRSAEHYIFDIFDLNANRSEVKPCV
jgi:hypothetical protein